MAPVITPTPGEALVIWRRRKNLNQFDAAKELDVPVDRLRQWESDAHATKPPQRHLGKLKDFEVCYLLRRREKPKLTQRELAKRLGCTRLWVIQMEEGTAPAERLKAYWKL